MGDHHGMIRGRSSLKDQRTILVELRSYVVTRENGEIKTVRIFLRCWKIKEAVMPLTFKPFINLAEAIALAKETGKPVLVKP